MVMQKTFNDNYLINFENIFLNVLIDSLKEFSFPKNIGCLKPFG